MLVSVRNLAILSAVQALLWRSANAHTLFTKLTIDGQDYDDTQCILPYWDKRNSPVEDTSSEDLMCRTSDMSGGSNSCSIAAGSTISIEYHRSKKSDDVVSASHVGPCLVYMSPAEANGKGDVWFKIFEQGWSKESGWCVSQLIENGGKLDFQIPSDLKPGEYLLRPELIGLHGARREGGCQFYPNCARVTVTGSGTAVPDSVALPGYYKSDDPGILYARKDDNGGYVIPGPPVYSGGGGSGGGGGNSTSAGGDSSGGDPATETQTGGDTSTKDPSEGTSESPGGAPSMKKPACSKKNRRKRRGRRREHRLDL